MEKEKKKEKEKEKETFEFFLLGQIDVRQLEDSGLTNPLIPPTRSQYSSNESKSNLVSTKS